MPITVSVTGSTTEEALKEIHDYFKPKEENVEVLLERLRKLLAPQGLVVSISAEEAKPNGHAEPVDLDASVVEVKRSRGGQPKLSKEAAAAALSEESETVKKALKAETAEARKARCVAKLQELFAAGRKKEVKDILLEHGDGAKSFHAVPEASFAAISDALEQLGA